VTAVQNAHQWVTFATAAPFQQAIAVGLALDDSYFTSFVADYARRRDRLSGALSAAGYTVLPCEGTYFLIADTGAADDFAFCRELVATKRVAAIPPSAFYSDAHKHEARSLARFAFCKTDAVLDEAAARLVT
jgi:N-succinyldiaminopimelate aminotransferase